MKSSRRYGIVNDEGAAPTIDRTIQLCLSHRKSKRMATAVCVCERESDEKAY